MGMRARSGEKGAPGGAEKRYSCPCPLADTESVTELNAVLRAHGAEDHRLQRRDVLVRGQLGNQGAQE